MTIKSKMVSAVVVVGLLLVALGAIVHWQLVVLEEVEESRILAGEVEVHLLEMRRHEKDFFARGDTRYVDKFQATHDALKGDLDRIDMLLTDASIETDAVVAMRGGLADYTGLFQRVVGLQREIGLHPRDGLYGSLRDAAHKAEALFQEQGDAGLQVHMLTLRRAEKDFMLRRDAKYLDRFNQAFAQMQSAQAVAFLADDVQQRSTQYLDAYKASFVALVDAERAIGLTHKDAALGELRSSVHGVETVLDDFEAALNDQIDAAAARVDAVLYGSLMVIIVVVATWLSWLGWSISRRAGVAAQNMREIAEGDGDLTRRLDASGDDEFADLATAFNVFATKIHDMLKRVAGMAAVLSETGSHVADAAGSTDDSMRKLRSNTQTVVVATEEMSATARDVASNAGQVSASTHDADTVAVQGRQTVEQSIASIEAFAHEFGDAASTITALRAETENIGGILDVIRSIAEQTNLLALNAAIEAARAGEQGRGFAVVADEVRTLAHRSQQSTSEIQELITRLQEQAESAVSMIQHGQTRITETVSQASEAGQALTRITESIGAISGMTTQIATAAEEQSAVVSDISSNVVSIDHLAQDTTQHADVTTDLSGRLAQAMSQVTCELKHFRFENDELLVLSQAKAAHFDWKARLRGFLDGHTELTSQQVSSHEHCDLGKWYYGEGVQRFQGVAEFKAIEDPHREIHKAIRRVVEAKERGDTQAAEDGYKEVGALSDQVVARIDQLAKTLD